MTYYKEKDMEQGLEEKKSIKSLKKKSLKCHNIQRGASSENLRDH